MKKKVLKGWTTDRPSQMADYHCHEWNAATVEFCSATRHCKCQRRNACAEITPMYVDAKKRLLKAHGIRYKDRPGHKVDDYRKMQNAISKILTAALKKCHPVSIVICPSRG